MNKIKVSSTKEIRQQITQISRIILSNSR